MLRFATLFLVGGCPYVFEQPNLSNVDADSGGTNDASSDADTDADSDADSDADTDTSAPVTPTLTSLAATPRLDGVAVHFSVVDAQNDLVGGSLHLTDGTTEFTLGIPADIDDWRPQGLSTATVSLGPWLDCDSPAVDRTWTATISDFAGNTGSPVQASFHVSNVGRLPENGNQWPGDAHRLDEVPPFMGCVTYEADDDEPGTIREQLFLDVEAMFFVTPDAGDYRFALTWEPAADIDIFVLPDPIVDLDGEPGPDVSATSATYSMPEQVVLTAEAGDSWMFDPTFFDLVSGGLPPFEAFFLVAPD